MNPRTEPPTLCPLDAYAVGLELIRRLAPKMKALDADTRKQLRRAASSVVHNTAEAWGRRGQDRSYHFRVAYASALETGAAIEVATAWGQLDAKTELALVGRIVAMLRRPAGWT